MNLRKPVENPFSHRSDSHQTALDILRLARSTAVSVGHLYDGAAKEEASARLRKAVVLVGQLMPDVWQRNVQGLHAQDRYELERLLRQDRAGRGEVQGDDDIETQLLKRSKTLLEEAEVLVSNNRRIFPSLVLRQEYRLAFTEISLLWD